MRPRVRRVVTPGAQTDGGVVIHPGLACAAPAGSREALELGLESERIEIVIRGRAVGSLPWLTSAAIPLPHGSAAAVRATLAHQATGMAPLLLAGALTLAAGLASGEVGVAGLAMAALLVLASVLVHELGHVIAYRRLFGATAPALVVVRGAACHVVRRADDSPADVAVVVAGGAAPVVVSLAALPLAPVAPAPVLFGALIAVGHLAALALPFGDGASLRAIGRERRRRRDDDTPRVSVVAGATRRRSRRPAG